MASDYTKTDNYQGLPAGAGSQQELVDAAIAAIILCFAKNLSDKGDTQDNITMVLKEVIENQPVT